MNGWGEIVSGALLLHIAVALVVLLAVLTAVELRPWQRAGLVVAAALYVAAAALVASDSLVLP